MIKARVRKPIPWKKIIAPTLAAVAAIGISVPVTIAIMKKHNQGTTTVQHTITYVDDYGKGSVITTQKVTDGELAKMYVPEHKSNKGFKGWKLVEQKLTQETEDASYFDFMNTPIGKDVTLYSHYRRNLETGECEADSLDAFEYSQKDDGIIITQIKPDYFSNGHIFDPVVPDTFKIDGKSIPVIGIGENAFADFEYVYNFNSISLPDTIKTFGSAAFAYNHKLRILNMPKDLNSIEMMCFHECIKLSDIKFYDKLEKIGDKAFMGEEIGSRESYIRSIEMPASLKFIGRNAFNLNAVQTLDLSKCNQLVLAPEAFKDAINLREIVLPEGLQYIPEQCFYNCARLRKMTIPSTVKYIENDAFWCCYRIREIYFKPQSELLFIESCAFGGCYSLDKINLPATLKSIAAGAFLDCFNLSYVTFDSDKDWYVEGKDQPVEPKPHDNTPYNNAITLLECGDSSFTVKAITKDKIKYLTDDKSQCFIISCDNDLRDDVNIPNNVEIDNVQYEVVGIAANAFRDHDGHWTPTGVEIGKITSVTFEENSPLQYIYDHAFDGCKYMTSINLSNCPNLKSIGSYAFYNALTGINGSRNLEIDLSQTMVENIGDFAFSMEESESNDAGLITSVTLPNTLKYLGNGAFYNQKSITTFNFFHDDKESLLEKIGNNQDSVLCCPVINSTTDIEINMSKCTNLTYLPRSAFQGATSLTSITLPEKIASIGDYAFEGCTNLTSIKIPSSCSYIGCGAFDKAGLTSATFDGTGSKNWLVYKGSDFETCDVSKEIEGMSLVASNAARLKTLFAQYSWLKID